MKKYQIFVSSTYEDLKEERDAVIKAILEMGHIPVGMEMFSAADEEQWKLIARHIQESDYYIVIVAHRYGSTARGVSYTEKEYDFAVSHGVPTLGFVIDEAAAWQSNRREDAALQKIKKFKAKIQRRLVAFWTSADDLSGKVTRSLVKQFTVTPRPGWVRATEAIDPSVVNEMSRLSEENRRLREELESLRTALPSAQLPDLEGAVHLAFAVYKKVAQGQHVWVETRSEEVSWLDILRAIVPDLIVEPVPEVYLRDYIGDGVEVDLPDEHYASMDEDSVRAIGIELMARGLIELECDAHRNVAWKLTPQGKLLFLGKREVLLEDVVKTLQSKAAES